MSDTCSGCDGNCCYDVVIRITGYDAWRIKRAQALALEQFVSVQKDEETAPGAFLLAGGYHALFLAKSAAEPRACTFLIHFPDEVRRCGIYAERPRVCAVYPFALRNGTVDIRSDVVCKPSNWNMATLNYPHWRRSLLGYMLEWQVYQRVVTIWNALAQPPAPGIGDYFAYIDRCFDGIDSFKASLGDGEFDELVLHSRDAAPSDVERERYERFFSQVDSVCSPV
jgi:Fe-S-cluster containining protein